MQPSPNDFNVRSSMTQIPNIKFQLNNPIKYIKLCWKKVMSKEGIDLRFRIHPVTAIIVATIIAAGSFGIGRVSYIFSQIPFISKIILTSPSPTSTPTSTPSSEWQNSRIAGILRVTLITNKYYLLTSSSIAISLQFDKNVDLTKYLGKKF